MPKKRRKLSKELEKQMSIANQKVELITAKINDINDEDIQGEYRIAFDHPKNTLLVLTGMYLTDGFTEETEQLMVKFNLLLDKFESEYEI